MTDTNMTNENGAPFKPLPIYTDVDKQALAAAEDAGIVSPAEVSENQISVSSSEISNRLNMLETIMQGQTALITYLFHTLLRTVNINDVLDAHFENTQGDTVGEVLDPTVIGRRPPPKRN